MTTFQFSPLELFFMAGFNAAFVAVIAAAIASMINKRKTAKYITKDACSVCSTRMWAEDMKQLVCDVSYLKQVVRLLAENSGIKQEELLRLENENRIRMNGF